MRSLIWLCAVAIATGCGDDGGGADTDLGVGSTSTSSTDAPTTDAPSTDPGSTTALGSSSGSLETSGEDSSTSSGSSSTGGPAGSEGCGVPAADTPMTWSEHTLDVGGVERRYWVWLPEGYDPMRPYPVVYQFHGCSGGDSPQNNNPPVQDQSGSDAIHIRGRAVGECWDSASEGADVMFFDALMADVDATLCADPARRFATGYSSGAFMSHRLGCERADVLRGVATIAGGMGGSDCPGQVAALLIHDVDDGTVGIGASIGARDAYLERNGCDLEAGTTPVDPEPCAIYSGCDAGYDVVWCETSGQDHSRQDGLSAPAFWGFLSALPALD